MVTNEKCNTVTVIDFETASSAYFSACALGLVLLKDGEIIDKQYFLIQPPDNYFDKVNIGIHGIKPEDTANAETFPAVWEKIKHFFNDTYIAAHNASFDMSVLKATLDYYELEQPELLYCCSIQISGLCIEYGAKVGKTLEERCKHFNVPLTEHHNALCDAEACAALISCSFKQSRYKNFWAFVKMKVKLKDYADIKLKKTFGKAKFRNISINEVAAAVDTAASPKDDDFMGKTFVFTGELKKLTREQAYTKVIAGGGKIVSAISKNVDVLVNADGQSSSKMTKALDLQAKGHHIKIVDDELFMQMLQSTAAVSLGNAVEEVAATVVEDETK